MCDDGEWGTVCRDDESFSEVEMLVVCRQLGFSIIGKYSSTVFIQALYKLSYLALAVYLWLTSCICSLVRTLLFQSSI